MYKEQVWDEGDEETVSGAGHCVTYATEILSLRSCTLTPWGAQCKAVILTLDVDAILRAKHSGGKKHTKKKKKICYLPN